MADDFMKKRSVSFFVSYAKANKVAVEQFLQLYKEQIGASKRFSYSQWSDNQIMVGDNWHNAIQEAISHTDFGILLVSPAFLNSSYIESHELPEYLKSDGKRCFPVMLANVDFDRHDLKGLQDKQIYRLDIIDLQPPRAFRDLKGKRKTQFVEKFFAQVDDWLGENYV
jgi:hypothetical protein